MEITKGQRPARLWKIAVQLNGEQRPFAVATVLQADNSTPVKAGARALIEPGGRIHGTVGGGLVEAEALRQAEAVMRLNKPIIFSFDLHGPGAREASPICGGAMRLLVAPGSSASHREYESAANSLAKRERALWVTQVKTGRELQATSRCILERQLKGKPRFLQKILRDGNPRFVASSGAAGVAGMFVEPLIPAPVLLIIGGGHVSQALAAQANLLDFDIVVLEDRPEFASPALFPAGTRTMCGDVERQLARFPIDKRTFIVIVTRGHQQDIKALRGCIRKPAAYIGMIGSSRKVPLVRREFLKSGWATAAEFNRIYAPIGLDIGAATVPEIATSILAQVIAVRRQGQAPRIPLK